MTVMTMTEARAILPQVLDRVAAGEEVTITRRGKPVAVMLRPDIVRSPVRAEIVTGEAGFHTAARRRAAAAGKVIDAAPMDVGDILAELDELRARIADAVAGRRGEPPAGRATGDPSQVPTG